MNVIQWLFRDRDSGKIKLAQRPNLPILTVVASTGIRWLFPDGEAARYARGTSVLALAWWGVLETASGINPFRRLLGMGALALLLARALHR